MKLWELFENKQDYDERQETLLESLEDQELSETEDDIVHPDIDFDYYVYVHPHRVEYYKGGKQIKVYDPLKKTRESEGLIEGAKMVWRRKGNKVVKGYRCTTGRKKGRLVDTPADCSKTIDLKKRFKMKKMLQQKGTRIRRKALRTKKRNPVSMRLQRMNKANRRKL